jgi:hypothetical protein
LRWVWSSTSVAPGSLRDGEGTDGLHRTHNTGVRCWVCRCTPLGRNLSAENRGRSGDHQPKLVVSAMSKAPPGIRGLGGGVQHVGSHQLEPQETKPVSSPP